MPRIEPGSLHYKSPFQSTELTVPGWHLVLTSLIFFFSPSSRLHGLWMAVKSQVEGDKDYIKDFYCKKLSAKYTQQDDLEINKSNAASTCHRQFFLIHCRNYLLIVLLVGLCCKVENGEDIKTESHIFITNLKPHFSKLMQIWQI